VLVVGFTAVVPVKATLPIALSMVTLLASVTLQLKVELSPTLIVDGTAEKELIMGTARGVPLHPAINTKTAIVKNKLKYLK